MKMKSVLIIAAAWLAAGAYCAEASDYFVGPGGDHSDGGSWATAFTNIQDAIDVSSAGDVIWVANGIYAPIDSGNKLLTIRAVSENQSDTVIDGGLSNRCATLGTSGSHTNTVLHGFTLHNAGLDGYGGGAYGGTIINCSFAGNTADYAAGAYNRATSAFTNSFFADNVSTGIGGALYLQNGTTVVSGGVFTNNHSGSSGGAVENSSSQLLITNGTLFIHNSAPYGGAICNQNTAAAADIFGAAFIGNSARFYGGAINNARAMTICDSDFIGNTATNSGGAIRNDSGAEILTLRVSAGRTNEFSGNTVSNGSNSIYMNSGTLVVDVDGTLNMFDPMSGTGSRATAIIKAGSGTWNLGGSNTLPATSLTVSNGTFNLLSGAFLNISNLTVETAAILTVELPSAAGSYELIQLGDTHNVEDLLAKLTTDAPPGTVFGFNAATKTIFAIPPQLEVSGRTIGSTGGTVTLPVRANVEWTAVSSAEWLSISGATATGLTVTATANESGAERIGTVVFSSDGLTATGTVIQLSAAIEAGDVRYVDANPSVQNPDGLSWDTAYPQIQTAYSELSNGVVYVASGVYAPVSSGGSKSITIRAVSEIQSDTVIDAGNDGRCATLGVNGAATNTVLRGFTLRNAAGTSDGGGAYAGTVINCSFIGNTANRAGALHSRAVTAFTNSLFSGNSATNDGGALYLYNSAGSSVISDAAFTGNRAGLSGGAIYLYAGTLTLRVSAGGTTEFSGNTAAGVANSIHMAGGTLMVDVAEDGALNMFDPMDGNGILAKTGGGVWNLGGNSEMPAAALTVEDGTLNLLSDAFLDIGTLTVEPGGVLTAELASTGRYDLIRLADTNNIGSLLAKLNGAAQAGVEYGFDGTNTIYAMRYTSQGVPYEWLEEHKLVERGGDYETAALDDSRKGYPVWHDYVSGVNPTLHAARFIAHFTNGVDIGWTPDLTVSGRVYTVYGKVSLSDTNWNETVHSGDTSNRFFHVEVKLP